MSKSLFYFYDSLAPYDILNTILYFSVGMALKTERSKQFPPDAPVSIIPSISVVPISSFIRHRRAFLCFLGSLDAAAPSEAGTTACKNFALRTKDFRRLHHIQRFRVGIYSDSTNPRLRFLPQRLRHRPR